MSLKVAVYAIALSEEANVQDWIQNTHDADMAYVCDTGSTDDTLRLLSRRCRTASIRVQPWRFDVARNTALALVPPDYDVCICLDLDERLSPGWREKLEEVWTPGTNRLDHRYVQAHRPDGAPELQFNSGRFHSRFGFTWHGAAHEELLWTAIDQHVQVVQTDAPELTIHHWHPAGKERSYLAGLQLAYAESHRPPRAAYYLGREYYYAEAWQKAVKYLTEYLEDSRSTFSYERSQAAVYLARCAGQLDDLAGRIRWARQATHEEPARTEGWFEQAWAYQEAGRWSQCLENCLIFLSLQPNYRYFSEYDEQLPLLLDMMAAAQWHLGRSDEAVETQRRAVSLRPEDERLQENLATYSGVFSQLEDVKIPEGIL